MKGSFILRYKSENRVEGSNHFVPYFFYDHYYTMFSRVESLSNRKNIQAVGIYFGVKNP